MGEEQIYSFMSVAVAQWKFGLLGDLFWGCLFVLWKRKSACWPVLRTVTELCK